MEIKKANNRTYFNIENIAYANISFLEEYGIVCLELLKVEIEHRQKGFGSYLFDEVISYIKASGYKRVELNPLPLDSNGLNLNELISFYKRHGFEMSLNKRLESPYLMEMFII
ncbi:MAG: GNAT family N-acetyltransferase [Campylobacteraceae bacterium]|nr:GNAT family N-acetyltransferase [Campylobacteraceae bacterium]